MTAQEKASLRDWIREQASQTLLNLLMRPDEMVERVRSLAYDELSTRNQQRVTKDKTDQLGWGLSKKEAPSLEETEVPKLNLEKEEKSND